MQRKIIAALGLMAATALLSPVSVRAENIAEGKRIYAESCAACHGTNLEGQPNWQQVTETGEYPAPPHDRTGHTWHHSDKVLIDYVTLGGAELLKSQGINNFKSGMPAFGEILTEQNILDVLAYIKSTWPPREQQVQKSRSNQ